MNPQFVPVAINERRCNSETELLSNELRIVVALIAAKRVGKIGCTAAELKLMTGVHTNIVSLERRLWVVQVGTLKKSTAKIWGPHPRAAVRLGLNGWQTVLFTDEELTRVDANLPGFLVPAANSGPELASTTGEPNEGERAAS